jgi:hypothetical protein
VSLWFLSLFNVQFSSYCGDNILFGREIIPDLIGHLLVAYPNRELSSIALYQLCFDSQVLLQHLRHTGGIWKIVSDNAVSYRN